MAINEVIFPTVPNPVSGDWAKAIELIEKAMQNVNIPLQVDGSNIPQGSTFQVGGHVYYADGDTAITGTPSDYVKLTVSGTTLIPSFVANLTGVTWNKIWNGYYDVSDDYYIFDEIQALIDTELSTMYSKFGELFEKWLGQALKPADTPTFAKINTGHGDVECYAMDQDLEIADSPSFANATIAGHNVDTQLNRINQDVKSTASPTFVSINTGNGAFEVNDKNQVQGIDAINANITLTSLSIGQTGFTTIDWQVTQNRLCILPSGGTYKYTTMLIDINEGSTNAFKITTSQSVAGGSTVISTVSGTNYFGALILYTRLS